jgi:hypothetical protein
MTRKSDDFDKELELEPFTCPGCGSEQGCYITPGRTESGRIYRDYFCEICDAPPGGPAKDERYPSRFDR